MEARSCWRRLGVFEGRTIECAVNVKEAVGFELKRELLNGFWATVRVDADVNFR